MSKNIRLDDAVYEELEEYRLKRETFSEAVDRLLKEYTRVTLMLKKLAGEGRERDK